MRNFISKFFKLKPASRGDTIVEVLISMTILALVLGTAYGLSNHSLQAGTDAGLRDGGVSFAQQQIEYLKVEAALLNSSDFSAKYKNTTPYCITRSGDNFQTNTTGCNNYGGTSYSVSVNYSDPDTPDIFAINVKWPATSGPGQDQATLYYKAQSKT